MSLRSRPNGESRGEKLGVGGVLFQVFLGKEGTKITSKKGKRYREQESPISNMRKTSKRRKGGRKMKEGGKWHPIGIGVGNKSLLISKVCGW